MPRTDSFKENLQLWQTKQTQFPTAQLQGLGHSLPENRQQSHGLAWDPAPTGLEDGQELESVMQWEGFRPILPLLPVRRLDKGLDFNRWEMLLALHAYSRSCQRVGVITS